MVLLPTIVIMGGFARKPRIRHILSLTHPLFHVSALSFAQQLLMSFTNDLWFSSTYNINYLSKGVGIWATIWALLEYFKFQWIYGWLEAQFYLCSHFYNVLLFSRTIFEGSNGQYNHFSVNLIIISDIIRALTHSEPYYS